MKGAILPRLTLLSLAGILVLAAGKGEASDAKPGEEKPAGTADLRPKIDDLVQPPDPDVNVIIDRVATRLGAFAVVAIASYPILTLALALLKVSVFRLPFMKGWIFTVFLPLLTLLLLMGLVTLVILTLSPIIEQLSAGKKRRTPFGRRTRMLGRWMLEWVAPIVIIAVFTTIVLRDQIEPIFDSTLQKLEVASEVCGSSNLTGEACNQGVIAELAKQDAQRIKEIEDAVARALAKEAVAR